MPVWHFRKSALFIYLFVLFVYFSALGISGTVTLNKIVYYYSKLNWPAEVAVREPIFEKKVHAIFFFVIVF